MEAAPQLSAAPTPASIVRVPLLLIISQSSCNILNPSLRWHNICCIFKCTLTLRPHFAIHCRLGLVRLQHLLAHGRLGFLSLNVTIIIWLPKDVHSTSMGKTMENFIHLTTIVDQAITLQIKGRTYASGINLYE